MMHLLSKPATSELQWEVAAMLPRRQVRTHVLRFHKFSAFSSIPPAAMILMDNKFASIPITIELGRLVFENLKKVALYLMPVSGSLFFLHGHANTIVLRLVPTPSSYPFLPMYFWACNSLLVPTFKCAFALPMMLLCRFHSCMSSLKAVSANL